MENGNTTSKEKQMRDEFDIQSERRVLATKDALEECSWQMADFITKEMYRLFGAAEVRKLFPVGNEHQYVLQCLHEMQADFFRDYYEDY
jgi:hypothetical protein